MALGSRRVEILLSGEREIPRVRPLAELEVDPERVRRVWAVQLIRAMLLSKAGGS